MAEMVDRDQEHLRLLSIGHYVLAGMTMFISLFALLYVALGSFIASGVVPMGQTPNGDPKFIGYIFLGFGGAFFVFGTAMAVVYFLVGRKLRAHRWRTFCLVIAGFSCIYIPWGTVIGVCTIMVLIRPDVKRQFEPGLVPGVVATDQHG